MKREMPGIPTLGQCNPWRGSSVHPLPGNTGENGETVAKIREGNHELFQKR